MSPTLALVLFGLTSVLIVSFDILYTYATRGLAYGFSSKRPVVEKTGLALRIERVTRNQAESTAYVVPALGAAALLGLSGGWVAALCALIVIGRAAFAFTYYTGIPALRTPFFALGSVGSLILMIMSAHAALN